MIKIKIHYAGEKTKNNRVFMLKSGRPFRMDKGYNDCLESELMEMRKEPVFKELEKRGVISVKAKAESKAKKKGDSGKESSESVEVKTGKKSGKGSKK